MRGPLVLATVAIGLATLPFIVLGQVVTAFSGPLVLTYMLAVLASLVVAFLLTPTLGLVLLRGEPPGRERRFARWVTRAFDRGFAVAEIRRTLERGLTQRLTVCHFRHCSLHVQVIE